MHIFVFQLANITGNFSSSVAGPTNAVQGHAIWAGIRSRPIYKNHETSGLDSTTIGHTSLDYFDDLIVLNQHQRELQKDVNSLLWLLQSLGFVINWEKSILCPTQNIEYLEFMVNSLDLTLYLPGQKLRDIKQECV